MNHDESFLAAFEKIVAKYVGPGGKVEDIPEDMAPAFNEKYLELWGLFPTKT